jgi:hypothetical protein
MINEEKTVWALDTCHVRRLLYRQGRAVCLQLLSLRWGISDRYEHLSHIKNQKLRKKEEGGDLQVQTMGVE